MSEDPIGEITAELNEANAKIAKLEGLLERLRVKVEARIKELEDRLITETAWQKQHEINFTNEHLHWVLSLIDAETVEEKKLIYKTLEQQIQELWESRGLEVVQETCMGIEGDKFKWTIIAKRKEAGSEPKPEEWGGKEYEIDKSPQKKEGRR